MVPVSIKGLPLERPVPTGPPSATTRGDNRIVGLPVNLDHSTVTQETQ